MNIARRMAAIERRICAAPICAVCGGKGRCVVEFINGPGSREPERDMSGCPSCGKRNVITVEYVQKGIPAPD